MSASLKPVEWVESCLEDLKEFPEDVRQVIGYALYLAQSGEKHPSAKPLKGFKGAGVLKVVEDFDGDTYLAVYTIKLAGVVWCTSYTLFRRNQSKALLPLNKILH